MILHHQHAHSLHFLFLAALWGGLTLFFALTFPLLPIDETRYLTVAWEMKVRGDWILPTLNYAPYSHKPPLLFWMINGIWSVTGGTALLPVRIMAGAVTFSLILLTGCLARALFPADENLKRQARLFLLASPILVIFGGLIMFDCLLGVCVLLGVLCLWQAASSEKPRWWVLFGLALGAGVLAKGPVVLLHMAPVALLAPLWAGRKLSWVKWYSGFLIAVIVATLVGLSWAVPAASSGGAEFSEKIFVSQTAGRMVKSFAHQRPLWFYLPMIPVFFLPVFCWPAFWRGMRSKEIRTGLLQEPPVRFLLCWIVPVFIFFSLISGKQTHYLIPILPGAAIFLARICRTEKATQAKDALIPALVYALLFTVVLAAPFAAHLLPETRNGFYVETVSAFAPWASLAVMILVFPVVAILSGKSGGQPMAFALITVALIGLFQFQIERRGYHYFDLAPLGSALRPYKDGPIAYVDGYQGEIGYLAGLTRPVEVIRRKKLKAWLAEHPGGVAVLRYRESREIAAYETVFTMPYKSAKFFAVIRTPQPHNPVGTGR